MTTLHPEMDVDALSGDLTRLVRAVNGVNAVFSSKPLLKTAVATVVEKIKHDTVGINLVHIAHTETGIEITATIGVADEEPAEHVCRRVYGAVDDYVRGAGALKPRIRVKVGRVG